MRRSQRANSPSCSSAGGAKRTVLAIQSISSEEKDEGGGVFARNPNRGFGFCQSRHGGGTGRNAQPGLGETQGLAKISTPHRRNASAASQSPRRTHRVAFA